MLTTLRPLLLAAFLCGCASYLDTAAREPGAQRMPSGLILRTLRPGDGPSPGPRDRVKVHYHGTLTDGVVVDSSLERGMPAELSMDRVIPCWTEGMQRMKAGEKARFVCPAEIAYGEAGKPPTVPGNATLVFDIELLEVLKNP
jgi:FKBP-type peptidyl-prolyl cis-trans isomerase FkpA